MPKGNPNPVKKWGPDNPPPRSPGRRKGVPEMATLLKKQVLKAGLQGKAAEILKEYLESKQPRKVEIALRFLSQLIPKEMSLSGGEAPIILEVAPINIPPNAGTGEEIEE